jgi:XTP/dITP diphosphohydrolase
MTKRLVVATGNPGKLDEMRSYLGGIDVELRLKPGDLDVEETGNTFLENACLKASQVALATGEWAIADDSGLAVDALGGAPGIYSARYAATDAERIARVLRELETADNRGARFICAIAIANPEGAIVTQLEGICPGEIAETPRGQQGFGYDPIFYVPEQQMTFAEMPPELKNQTSHRGRAFAKLLPQLPEILNPND